MDLTDAREIVAEQGVEENAEFGWFGLDGERKGDIRVTEIESNSEGVRTVHYVIKANGGEHEKSDSVRKVAKSLNAGYWESVGGNDEDSEVAEDEAPETESETDDEKELVTDGGQVSDGSGFTIDDYPDRPDGEEKLVGLNEWGGWAYEPVHNRLRNYKREDEDGKMPLTETSEAEEKVQGEDLVDRLDEMDVLTPYGYRIIYGHGGVEVVVNRLLRDGLSPGQAWSYFGVKVIGESRNQWSKKMGYSDHSAVSEAVRKAEEKLGQ